MQNFKRGNPKVRYNLGDLDVVGNIIKWILKGIEMDRW
jgi:hypothetical protein